MDTIFIVLVGILFLLAISDLVVGVSNDAVNFLVSAIGSKAAPFWAIMITASVGVVVGSTFSSGMMEVARKGVFHPDQFVFQEIMIIFLAVMLTDVILLDVFNTFGLPTSTTVSIVFELLGAAVAISVIKISASDGGLHSLGTYINTEKALAIIAGILLSVVVAFTLGAVVQYIARVLFTFNYATTYTYFGAIWGGIAITAITYFIIIKGAKGASFMTEDTVKWIKTHTALIIFGSFVVWTLILQLINWFTRLNIFKIVVLAGTFALAMAFAGNDLVNFIGVPLAGLKSYEEFAASGLTDPMLFSMESLKEPVKTRTIYLLTAGLIMVITLWFSKKSRSVTETSIDLSRQEEGYERFGSTMLSRSIVRWFISMVSTAGKVIPLPVKNVIKTRFERSAERHDKVSGAPAFDLIRASVNLVMASIIISFATSLKLPLSTTYVTFMVAMGSSLADGAWGRESAVYRVTGVVLVIGGWFMTALVAFTVAALFAVAMWAGGYYVVFVLVAVAGLMVYRTRFVHKKRSKKKEKAIEYEQLNGSLTIDELLDRCNANIIGLIEKIPGLLEKDIEGVAAENRKLLKKTLEEVDAVNTETKQMKDNVHRMVKRIDEDAQETGHFYVQAIDYLREIGHCVYFIVKPSYEHIDNNHKRIVEEQIEELKTLHAQTELFIRRISDLVKSSRYGEIQEVIEMQQKILKMLVKLRKQQIKRIKKEVAGTKNSVLYLNMLAEWKNMVLYIVNMLKSHRDFVLSNTRFDRSF